MPITTDSIITIISFLGMVASFAFMIRNMKRGSKEEIQKEATEKADIAHAMQRTSDDISEIRSKCESIDDKLGAVAEKQTELDKEVAIVKRDLKTAFNKIDELKGK